MNRKCKAIIKKLSFPLDGCLNYNVQLWYGYNNSFVYAGNGKFFETLEDAEQYAKQHDKNYVEVCKNENF